ncbi:MAG: hypothetical protein ACJAZP_003199 [Psychromonas sp.]|jgi:hypothetical protein
MLFYTDFSVTDKPADAQLKYPPDDKQANHSSHKRNILKFLFSEIFGINDALY